MLLALARITCKSFHSAEESFIGMEPTVSIVLPTYNRGKTLKRAVDSVLNQTFNDFELIMVDDRSTDDTHKLLREYSVNNQVRVVSQISRGCSAARNIGVGGSRGRYIAFQDSDDEWMPHKLETAVAHWKAAGLRPACFYSDMLRVERDGSSYYFPAPDVQRGVLISEDTLDYQVHCIGIQSAVIKRECFDKTGLFDESLKDSLILSCL